MPPLTTSPGRIKVEAWSQAGRLRARGLLKAVTLEERVYRMRCVEGWSMVIPGSASRSRISSSGSSRMATPNMSLSKRSSARRKCPDRRGLSGAGMALCRGSQAGRGDASVDHPRHRPLRRDAAQPERRADPAGRALEIRLQGDQVDRAHHLVENQPPTTWNIQDPREYGFYSNVNPEVDHPRWSQATERRIGEVAGYLPSGVRPDVQRL